MQPKEHVWSLMLQPSVGLVAYTLLHTSHQAQLSPGLITVSTVGQPMCAAPMDLAE